MRELNDRATSERAAAHEEHVRAMGELVEETKARLQQMELDYKAQLDKNVRVLCFSRLTATRLSCSLFTVHTRTRATCTSTSRTLCLLVCLSCACAQAAVVLGLEERVATVALEAEACRARTVALDSENGQLAEQCAQLRALLQQEQLKY